MVANISHARIRMDGNNAGGIKEIGTDSAVGKRKGERKKVQVVPRAALQGEKECLVIYIMSNVVVGPKRVRIRHPLP